MTRLIILSLITGAGSMVLGSMGNLPAASVFLGASLLCAILDAFVRQLREKP